MSRFSSSDRMRNKRHLAQFVVTSFLCHSLHPMSHCMRIAPALSTSSPKKKHLILNSNCLRTFEDARLETVTYLEVKFRLRIRDSKPSDTGPRGHSDPMDVDGVNILSLLAKEKEKGHRVRVMGVLSVVEHLFNEIAMHARAQASNRLEGKQSKSWSKSEGKGKSKEIKRKYKGKSRGTKRCQRLTQRVKHHKLVSQAFKTRTQRQARKLSNLHRRVPLTILGFMIAGVMMNGMVAGTGVWLDGTTVGNKRMTLPQAQFH